MIDKDHCLKLSVLAQRMYPITDRDKGCNRILIKKHSLRTIQLKKWVDELEMQEDKEGYIQNIETNLVPVMNVERQ